MAASSAVEESALAATRKQPQTKRPTKAVGRAKVPAKPARRPVSHHELNTFLRSPAGKAKLKVYKQQAFDVPRRGLTPASGHHETGLDDGRSRDPRLVGFEDPIDEVQVSGLL